MVDSSGIIDQWVDLALGKPGEFSDTFFRFIALWMAFNGYYESQYGHLKDDRGCKIGDRRQLENLADADKTKRAHQKLMREPDYSQSVRFLVKRRGVSDVDVRDEYDLYWILMAVYKLLVRVG